MHVQINTARNVTGNESLIATSSSILSKELSRFSHQITRVEVHFADEDSKKEGYNDKRCVVEARLAGLKPFAVTNYADTHEQAFLGAIGKLKTSLEKISDRLKEH